MQVPPQYKESGNGDDLFSFLVIFLTIIMLLIANKGEK